MLHFAPVQIVCKDTGSCSWASLAKGSQMKWKYWLCVIGVKQQGYISCIRVDFYSNTCSAETDLLNASWLYKILQYSIFSSHQKYVAHSFPSCPQMNFLGRQSSKKIAARMPGDWYMWPASVTEIVKMKTSAVLHVFPIPQPYPLVLLLCWLIISHNLC